jgi:dipeptidyl aminopeptidase/acylaminoacyl peptidase
MATLEKEKPSRLLMSLIAAAGLGVLVMASQTARAQEASTPLEVFGRLPSLEDVVISPAGTKLAFVRTAEDSRTLIVSALTKPEILGAVRVGETKLREVKWIDDDNLLTTISGTGPPPFGYIGSTREWFQLATYTVSKKSLRYVSFKLPEIQTFNVSLGGTAVRDVGGEPMLYAMGYYQQVDRLLPGLFSFTIPGQRTRLIARGTEPRTDWLIDKSGQIAAQFIYYDNKKLWEIKARKEDRLEQVASGTASIDAPNMLGFSADGSAIIVRETENGGSFWKPLYLKDGSWGPPLANGETFAGVIEDRKSGRIIGGVHEIGDTHYVFFDNELQAHWNAILRAFPDERIRLTSNTDDYTKVLVKVFGERDGYVYAAYDWYTHQATILGQVYDGLTAPAKVKPISFSAADGLAIPGFLTLPHGLPEKDLPLIVMPHGGPAAADTADFDWWAQALAAQGYAVLQPNYRGSILNSRFVEAGFGEWGRRMQTDLSDGVRYLAKQGVIDPKRVCIVGASYGGYAALAGVTLDPGVYRCAVSVAGISDLKRFRKWTAATRTGLTQRYWDRYLGISDENDPALLAVSPIEHISAVTVPVLLIHGRDDTVVPYEQSDVMLSALKRAGKSVEMVTLKDEDHWLSHSATRLQMLQASVAFLRANNPPN